MEKRCCGGCRSRSVTLQLRPCRARFIGRATAKFAARLAGSDLHLVPSVRILCTFSLAYSRSAVPPLSRKRRTKERACYPLSGSY